MMLGSHAPAWECGPRRSSVVVQQALSSQPNQGLLRRSSASSTSVQCAGPSVDESRQSAILARANWDVLEIRSSKMLAIAW